MTPPRHVAIIMDGNGRWARSQGALRADGHRAGVGPVRTVIEECLRHGIEALTVFAFSSENWKRPRDEVLSLMALFVESLDTEIESLAANGVRVRFIGERALLEPRLQTRMADAQTRTATNERLALQIAFGYGGRHDIVSAARELAGRVACGGLSVADIDEAQFAGCLALAGLPDPDLFIRTGGEQRLSNFVLWNLAYTELYFTDLLWPQFDAAAFGVALEHFAQRQRRFGLTAEQASGPKTPAGGLSA